MNGRADGRFRLMFWALVIVVYAASTVLNVGDFIMGGTPSVGGVVASIVFVLAWPLAAGAFSRRSRRLAIGVVTVAGCTAIGGVLLAGALLEAETAAPLSTVAYGLLLALVPALYGIVGLLGGQQILWYVVTVGAGWGLSVVASMVIGQRRLDGSALAAGNEYPS